MVSDRLADLRRLSACKDHPGWRGKKAAALSIIGFSATLFCYLGVNLILSGLHSYGGA